MKHLSHIFIIAGGALSLVSAGCSCSSHNSDAPATDIEDVNPEIRYAAIAAADSVIALSSDVTALNEKLLDVRASIYTISTTRGQKEANDFEFVFKEHISDECDSLANILF
ncbi:MAG: hypothetical protein HDS56_08430 [Barnesiella sp.]|nr:hypothetical protein [Barnesiella sp.]